MDRTWRPIPFLSSLRNRFQLLLFGLTLAIGLQFYFFVGQAGNGGPITIQRPAGVEGFLPIGALLGWKQLLITGIWDPVHPAAMVFLLYAAVISLLFRKSFCSWFCPVGTLSEWLWKLGHQLIGKNIQLPVGLDLPLRSLKYLLLSFFVYITFKMTPTEIVSFFNSPYYKLADVKMLHFFTRIGTAVLITVVVLILFSVIVRNFWCRYLCPYGALMGIFGIFSPECSGCLDCIHTCPAGGTLSIKTFGLGRITWKASRLAIAIGVSFCVMVFVAQITGHWKSGISDGEFKMLLKMIDSPMFIHPSF